MTILDLHPQPGKPVYVYEFPVRIWHWTMAACIFTQIVTGHYIGMPGISVQGDPTYIFKFGTLIKIHYISGLILCFAMLCRLLWAFFGNVVSRQIFIVKVWQKSWWQGLLDNLKWYAFLTRKPDARIGHNPLAQIAMFFIILVIFFMCFTGLGIMQAKQSGSFLNIFSFVEDWIYAIGGNGYDLVLLHGLGTIVILAFIFIHLYMVIRESIMGRTTMIYTMISGNRLVVDKPAISRRTLKAEEQSGE